MANFHNKSPIIENDMAIQSGNFSHEIPNTPIFEGVTGLVINGGNFTNRILPVGTVFNKPLPKQVSYCKHLHPEMTLLPDEGAENEPCPHSGDALILDGEIVGYFRENKPYAI